MSVALAKVITNGESDERKEGLDHELDQVRSFLERRVRFTHEDKDRDEAESIGSPEDDQHPFRNRERRFLFEAENRVVFPLRLSDLLS